MPGFWNWLRYLLLCYSWQEWGPWNWNYLQKYINNNTLQSAPHKNVDRPIFAVSGADKFFPDYVDIVGIIHPECDSHQSTFHLTQQAGYVCTMEIWKISWSSIFIYWIFIVCQQLWYWSIFWIRFSCSTETFAITQQSLAFRCSSWMIRIFS